MTADRVYLLEEPYGPVKIFHDKSNNGQISGIVSLRNSVLEKTNTKTEIMELFIAGDSAVNLYTTLNSDQKNGTEKPIGRPMIQDVMTSILGVMQESNPRHWGLLRVAIVSLEHDVFVGRMFFGDKVIGKSYYDCEVRPSDGLILALQSGAPIFVNLKVWQAAKKPLTKSTVYQMLSQSNKALPNGTISDLPSTRQSKSSRQGDLDQSRRFQRPLSPADLTDLLDDDLSEIKLLKRKLLIAVKEEDYSTAAAIRDHPYLLVYREICQSKIHGDSHRAAKLESELQRQIENNVLRTSESNPY